MTDQPERKGDRERGEHLGPAQELAAEKERDRRRHDLARSRKACFGNQWVGYDWDEDGEMHSYAEDTAT